MVGRLFVGDGEIFPTTTSAPKATEELEGEIAKLRVELQQVKDLARWTADQLEEKVKAKK